MSRTRRLRWFDRHPRAAVLLALTVLAVLLDFGIPAVESSALFERRENWEGAPRMRRPDPYYHHGLVPNGIADSADYRGERYRFVTNSLGFRDREVREVRLQRPDSVRFRLAFIGDSFTEGIGVSWDSTLVGRVAAAFAQDSVEVLNMGVAGNSPILEERKLRYYLDAVGLQVDEVALVLDLSDVWDELSFRAFVERMPPDTARPVWRRVIGTIGGYSLTYSTLRTWWHQRGFTTPEALRPSQTWRDRFNLAGTPIPRDSTDGVMLMAQGVARIDQFLHQRRVPLDLTIYPWPDQKELLDSLTVRYRETLLRLGRTQRIPVFDLFPPFIDAFEARGGRALEREYFIRNDVHWNSAGSGLAASAWLAAWCKARGPITPHACAARTGAAHVTRP